MKALGWHAGSFSPAFKKDNLTAIIVILLAGFSHLAAQIPPEERQALIALYHATEGPDWHRNRSWLRPPGTERNWYGITVEEGHVTEIRLQHNHLNGSLPPEISNLSHLRALYLDNFTRYIYPQPGNFIRDLPPELGTLSSLEVLSLAELGISELPPELGNLNNLNSLNLYNNDLQQLPVTIEGLKRLEVLNLAHNEIVQIPPQIGGLESLKELDLSRNRLADLPPQFAALATLEVLSLSSNPIVEFPAVLALLPQLQRLRLLALQWDHLSPRIGDLVHLKISHRTA